jgi:hypothetical protein
MVNPVKQIGRHKLPILNVTVITARDDGDGYDVQLNNGSTIRFTEEEKETYEKEMEHHELVLYIYGAARGMGLRG